MEHTRIKIGSRLVTDFRIKEVLGAGSFGTVLQCENRIDRQSYAIKLTASDDEESYKEVKNLVRIGYHKYVVQYITCWKDQITKTEITRLKRTANMSEETAAKFIIPPKQTTMKVMCIQMELCREDLRYWLSENQVVDDGKTAIIFIGISKGLEYIHKNDIIHRDLKPENIFMSLKDESIFKIGDFGVAKVHNLTAYHTSGKGTPLYLAPEQDTNKYGKAVDMYALGIILYELLYPSMQPAANKDCFDELLLNINRLKYSNTIVKSVESRWPNACVLIKKLISFNPTDRPSFDEIYKTFDDRGVPVVHHEIQCDNCGKKNIEGIRYKCSVCADYDLCEKCESKTGLHPSHHILQKIRLPGSYEQRQVSNSSDDQSDSSVNYRIKNGDDNNDQNDGKDDDKVEKRISAVVGELTKCVDKNGATCKFCYKQVSTWYRCDTCLPFSITKFDVCLDCYKSSGRPSLHVKRHSFTRHSIHS